MAGRPGVQITLTLLPATLQGQGKESLSLVWEERNGMEQISLRGREG